MNNAKLMQLFLRIAIFGEFIGHGIFALQGKKQWVGWIGQMLGTNPETSAQLLFLVGVTDILVAFIILVRPIRVVVLWATLWAFWTALVRPLVGEPIWDFVERWANWGAPLALLFCCGLPKTLKEWFR